MMNDIMNFLTSKEMIIVCAIALTGLLLTLIVFIAEKTYHKRKVRHNTRELKNLVREIAKKTKEKAEVVDENRAVQNENQPVVAIEKDEKQIVAEIKNVEEPVKIEPIKEETEEQKEKVEEESKLQYTTIEPNEMEAKEELRRATENLIQRAIEDEEEKIAEEIEEVIEEEFEDQEERDAVISIEELMKKSTGLSEAEEINLYEDEGDEPISISDLENRMNSINDMIEEVREDAVLIPIEEEKEEIKVHNKNVYSENVTFKSSPIISPIFGIEDSNINNDMEFENTANYDKFDDEMRKTNEFIVTLKELQKKLD